MTERRERDEAGQREARPQEAPTKKHGDKLDPVIPRGADQKGDAGRDESDQGTEGT